MRIRKTGPITPPNRGNIVNQYGTSQTDTYSQEYINDAIPTKTSDLINDSNFATKDVATPSANGLMSASDKTKLDNGEVYSTAETRVGTWIDGKPLYRRVVDLGEDTTIVENTWIGKSFPNNIETIVNGLGVRSNSATSQIRVGANSTTLQLMNPSPAFGIVIRYVVIEYTKTTD